jgi:hypothetical protein
MRAHERYVRKTYGIFGGSSDDFHWNVTEDLREGQQINSLLELSLSSFLLSFTASSALVRVPLPARKQAVRPYATSYLAPVRKFILTFPKMPLARISSSRVHSGFELYMLRLSGSSVFKCCVWIVSTNAPHNLGKERKKEKTHRDPFRRRRVCAEKRWDISFLEFPKVFEEPGRS